MPTNTAHHSGYTYFLPTQPYFTNTQVCLFCGVGVERILSQQIYMFPSMPFSVIIILHNLIKSTVFIIFCPARQLFRHQYYTLNMARQGKKSVISHFHSACSWKHIDPLISLHHFGAMISEFVMLVILFSTVLHFNFLYFTGILFGTLVIVDTDKHHITCIFTDKTGIVFFFDLLDCSLGCLIPFQFNDHCRK